MSSEITDLVLSTGWWIARKMLASPAPPPTPTVTTVTMQNTQVNITQNIITHVHAPQQARYGWVRVGWQFWRVGRRQYRRAVYELRQLA